jgi:hypothetical protein
MSLVEKSRVGAETEVMLFCRFEHREFPCSEFLDDPRWGTIHDVTPLHNKGGMWLYKDKSGQLTEFKPPHPEDPPSELV